MTEREALVARVSSSRQKVRGHKQRIRAEKEALHREAAQLESFEQQLARLGIRFVP